MALEPEGAHSIVTRLCLTLFTVTEQQPMKHNDQIYDLIWVVVDDYQYLFMNKYPSYRVLGQSGNI